MACLKRLAHGRRKVFSGTNDMHSLPSAGLSDFGLHSMHTDLAALANEHGPVFRLGRHIVVVGDADLAEHILSTRYAGRPFGFRWEDPDFFPFAKWGQIIGASETKKETAGIFFGNGPEHWLPARRAAQQGFLHGRAIRDAGRLAAASAASDLTERWRARGEGDYDVLPDIRDATLDVVTRVAFGGEGMLDEDASNELRAIYANMVSNFEQLIGLSPSLWWITKRRQSNELHEIADRLRSLFGPIFQRRIEARSEAQPRRCIVDLLLDSGMSEGAVLLNSLQILGAGHDTTATSLAMLLWQLAQDTPLQDALRKEAWEAESEDDAQLPLLSACVKEVLRMWPAAPIIVRQSCEASSWKGLEFPSGTIALVMPWLLGRSGELWGDPQVFRPQRFLERSAKSEPIHKFALIPFGYGMRSCVGQHLAVAELKTFTVALLRHLRFTANETPPHLQWFLTLRLPQGLTLKIEPLA